MASLKDILSNKGSQVFCVSPEASVMDAALLMNEHKIGGLAVTDTGRLLGIITERDMLRRVLVQSRDPASTKVSDVMTTDVVCAKPHTSIEEAKSVMKNRRFRHLPIVDAEGRLCGMISIGDLNAHETIDKEMTIHYLQSYIYGSA